MRAIVAALMIVAAPAWAEDWQPLRSDDAITQALSGRALQYDAYTFQRFGPAGDTQYVTERLSVGRWAARGGQYCSMWPPSDIWACYDIEILGDAVRFIGSDRSVSQGRYRN